MSTLQLIKHRINRIADLDTVDLEWGVEVDLRSDLSQPGKLVLHHEPWKNGDDFQQWLERFCELKIRGPIILNTKEDGLESQIINCMEQFELSNWFFLDTALPTLVKWTIQKGEKRFAIRFSSYEPLELVQNFSGKAQWVWVDCFAGVPVGLNSIAALSENFKICLVSPELQDQSEGAIKNFLKFRNNVHAVCTKFPQKWS